MNAGVSGLGFFAMRIAVAFLLFLLLAGSAWAERRVALVIGADDYRTARRLENAVNDARAIEQALKNLSFEVFVETNRDLRRMRRALQDFRIDAAGADVALVFFAGHGVEIAGENRLLPVDADASSLEALEATSLPLEEITETIRAVASVALVLLDACRNDPFGTAAADGRGAAPLTSVSLVNTVRPGLGRVGKAENVLFAFAAAPGKTASDGSDANSPFTAALVRYLGTDGLQVGSALKLVQQDVYDRTRKSQLPYIEDGLPAMFFAAARGELPERERLLLAMADLSADMREEVERVAAARDMPLAPLYAALIVSGLSKLTVEDRVKKLEEAAQAYTDTHETLRTLATTDPEVTLLRAAAENSLALGSLAEAEAHLDLAIAADRKARTTLGEVLASRTVSEAASLAAKAGVAHTAFDHAGAIAALEEAAALYEGVEALPISDSVRRARDRVLGRLGDIYALTGNASKALDAYERLHRVADAWFAGAPNEADAQYDLALSLNKIGDVQLDQGNLAAALTSFSDSQAVLWDLASRHPGHLDWQFERAVALSKVGDVQMAQSDLAAALNTFRESRAMMQLLVARDPGNAKWQLYLAIVISRVGDAQMAQVDPAAALKSFKDTLAILESLGAQDPRNAKVQRDLSVVFHKMGDVQRAQGDLTAALRSYRDGHAVVEPVAASDPGNARWQFDVAASLGRIGDVQLAQGDAAAASKSFSAAVAIMERLAARDPRNSKWKGELAAALHMLGDVQAAQGNLAAALSSHRAGNAIIQHLAASDPSNPKWRGHLSLSLRRIGEVLIGQGDLLKGLESYRDSLVITERLVAAYPGNAQWQRHLMVLHVKIAQAGQDTRRHLTWALELGLSLRANGTLVPKDAWMLDDIRSQLERLGSTEK